ncbi:hypothetical protein KSC_093040 [Ktedonobacter sp. SOSP1-52]|uniref:MFS transporter n=1 Tax=Ktedonobacter sp. SOSP1-52 TaxID=2778366 RepID=UPI0019156460|nr:MFS transporter [Ktedonobacter sp. SOSP1-52]GHO70412.1 hypothetical protein KSC_093040 [Ktedonobacter sp. SOSP1-52]
MRRWSAVIVLGLTIFMTTVDMSIVTLALPAMGQTFRQTDEAMSAVLLSYLIPSTLLLIPSGLVVTRWQPLPTFLGAIGGFAGASVLCALAPSFELLLIGRALQGTIGALLGTQGLPVVAAVIKPQERGRAMGILGAMGPLGAITGPGIGGLLLSTWGWPVIFLINVPVSLLAAGLALYSLRRVTLSTTRVSGLDQMRSLLGQRRFLAVSLTLLAFSSASGALSYLLPFALQDIHHLNSALAGLTLLVPSLGMAVMGPLGGYLVDRCGVRLLMPVGWMVTLLGLLALLLVIATPTSVFNLDWRLLLIGLGNSVAYIPLLTLLMSVGPRSTLGSASALSGVTRQLGFTCGPLLVSVLWSWQIAASSAERMRSSMLLLIGLVLVGFISTLIAVRGLSSSQLSIPDSAKEPASSGQL